MSRKLIDKGNARWDLVLGDGVQVELAREPLGWRFWGLVIDGQRMGGRDKVPPALVEVFEAMALNQTEETNG